MNSQVAVFLLFREYVDQTKSQSRPYINGDTFPLGDTQPIEDEFYTLIDILSFFQYEQKNIYYDVDNFDGLLFQADLFPNSYPNMEQTFLSQFEALGVSELPIQSKQNNGSFYCFFNMDVSADLLGNMAWHQQVQGVSCVLIHNKAINTLKDDTIVLQCTNNQKIMLSTKNSIPSLHKWFSVHRHPQRNYHYNPKHGDAHNQSQYINDSHGNYRKAAQLLTDTDATQELLKYAVGRDLNSELWYYDDNNDCFIYFENEGNTPQLGFHAYHLHFGEENYENIDIEKLRQIQDCIPENI